jgi:hypothetical protein
MAFKFQNSSNADSCYTHSRLSIPVGCELCRDRDRCRYCAVYMRACSHLINAMVGKCEQYQIGQISKPSWYFRE